MSDPFWTFIPQKMIIAAEGDGNGMVPDVTVTGWFAIAHFVDMKKDGGGGEPALVTKALTPADQPVTLRLPPDLLDKKPIVDLSTQDVIAGLNRLFAYPFNNIPAAPKDTESRTPPSKRKPK